MNSPPSRILLLTGLLASMASHPAAAVIDAISTICGEMKASETVLVFADRSPFVMTVRGFGVDFVQRLSVSGLQGAEAKITSKVGGPLTHVVIQLKVPLDSKDGDEGRITLHYPVGEDSFKIKVVAPAIVAAIEVNAPKEPQFGLYVLDPLKDYQVTVKGRMLQDLRFMLREPVAQFAEVQVVSKSDKYIQLKLTPKGTLARAAIHLHDFVASGSHCTATGRQVLEASSPEPKADMILSWPTPTPATRR